MLNKKTGEGAREKICSGIDIVAEGELLLSFSEPQK